MTVATLAASAAVSARFTASAPWPSIREISIKLPTRCPTGSRFLPRPSAPTIPRWFSAAQQDQTAQGNARRYRAAWCFHGRAAPSSAGDARRHALTSVVYERVKAVLEGSNVPDQEPDLDAPASRREQPLFGGVAAKSDKERAAALGTSDDGSVSLDIGRASGLGVGSEFTATAPNSAGQTVRLRITSLDGLARSSAEIVGLAGAKVSPGDLFELSKWIPADNPPLLVWLWPSNLSEDQIDAATAQVQASGAALVSDPAEQQWTHVLSWDENELDFAAGRLGCPRGLCSARRLLQTSSRRTSLQARSFGSIFRRHGSLPRSSSLLASDAPRTKSPATCPSHTTRSPASSLLTVRPTPGITRASWQPDHHRPMLLHTAQAAPLPRSIPCARIGFQSAMLQPSMPPGTNLTIILRSSLRCMAGSRWRIALPTRPPTSTTR